jgi:hypothetical protein
VQQKQKHFILVNSINLNFITFFLFFKSTFKHFFLESYSFATNTPNVDKPTQEEKKIFCMPDACRDLFRKPIKENINFIMKTKLLFINSALSFKLSCFVLNKTTCNTSIHCFLNGVCVCALCCFFSL